MELPTLLIILDSRNMSVVSTSWLAAKIVPCYPPESYPSTDCLFHVILMAKTQSGSWRTVYVESEIHVKICQLLASLEPDPKVGEWYYISFAE